ncbi:helix-turn-helix domain-containing protein [Salinibacterium hongtaonis]|uniref:helix-turn-helix domain-containing protein n=1 Tax=Homoserinimonas hongtaonis TaxID=2079791 RepID=UPI0018EFB229|nr:helix-turn-helix domain-containing protein [Salinibacterium hongtaonis]
MKPAPDWSPVTMVIDRVATDDELLRSVVTSVRVLVRESAALSTADIVGHTRALIFAATRAIADRRAPTQAELSFVEDFAVTRASQGVPLESVLGAVHVSERTIWARARELAAESGLSPDLLLDARELYDDWAEAVRTRIIMAHRAASSGPTPSAQDRDASVVRRLLEGGTAATLAATEVGLPIQRHLWVVIGHGADTAHWQGMLGSSRTSLGTTSVSARLDGWFAAVTSRDPRALPQSRAAAGPAGGFAGPVDADELVTARRLAAAALTAAQSRGITGLVHVAEVPTLAALTDRPDLAAMLADHHASSWSQFGASGPVIAQTVVAWLDADRDVNLAAESLFVHPNTVRNRVQGFSEITEIDVTSTLGAMDAWWLCTTWLAL